MASWSEILNQIHKDNQINFSQLEDIRKQYLSDLATYRNRNVIAYYSGWMYRAGAEDVTINDKDINAFMEVVHNLDKTKGLDLILHTPGGEIAATEQIVNYLHSCFSDITVIVPQMAMSAGSIISVSCNEIIMGKESCLGPFDPQLGGVACQSVLKEFENAKLDIQNNPAALGLWQIIVNKYPPTFLYSCAQAVALTDELADKYLGKVVDDQGKLENIKKAFNDNTESKIHSRHFSKSKLQKLGLNVRSLEDDQALQDIVLSLHHCFVILLENVPITKCVENNIGGRYMRMLPQINSEQNKPNSEKEASI